MSQQKPLPYVVKDSQPEYITVEDDYSGPHGFSDDPKFALRADFIEKVKGVPAVRGWWRCPYCKMEFNRRKSCEKHMGLVPNLPAYCRVLLDDDEARRSRANTASTCVQLLLTVPTWRSALQMAELHLSRKKKYARTHLRQHSRARKYDEEIRTATDGLVTELAFQQKYFPDEPWNAKEESTKLADIGTNHEVRCYNAIPRDLICQWWRFLSGRIMHLGLKRDVPLSKILNSGHVEVYKDDHPDRDITFIVIENPGQAWIVGNASIRACQQEEFWAENYQYKIMQEKESRCFWVPVSFLTPAIECSWFTV
jgi:hypothetical protein